MPRKFHPPLSVLLIILYSQINFGCSKKDESARKVVINNFPINMTLHGEPILLNEINSSQLYLVDTLLLVEQLELKQWNFNVYSIPELNFVGNLGRVGDGPKEWRKVRFSHQTEISDSGKVSLWVNDIRHARFQLVDLRSNLNKVEPNIFYDFKHPKELDLIQNLIYLDSNKWVGNLGPNSLDRGRFLVYNPISRTTNLIPFNLNVINEKMLTLDDYYDIYFSSLRVNKDKTKLISAMHRFDRIDIFDTSNLFKPILSIVGKKMSDNLDASKIKQDNSYLRIFYFDLFTSESYIYALYFDQPYYFYGNNLKSTEIRVFDWTGTPIAKFLIPEYLTSFTIDEKNGFIYGASYFQEKIMRYPFSLNE
ncbi:hypothetical protein AWW67_18145 [Roseivirga seohaensis]|uniref:TolB-like 6-blade propeller-like protein n=1 Tax=Roseivirga seohaensis TaxID=1914963 RepID=A0A150Y1Q8_9BACT|nr:BF3164 family lipoprotein [Roseivirga seohaensis]KYG84866.1 hypothetical protein AWW67_18145 [Roseivirga seohaensis]